MVGVNRFTTTEPSPLTTDLDAAIQTADPLAEASAIATVELASTEDMPPPAGFAVPLEAALKEFVGKGSQRPPAFSARHVGGERSYRLARRGVEVELPESEVTVHEMALVAQEHDQVTFRVTASAGTYVRAIARDLGERLGTGAHLTALRREAIGPIEVSRAVPLAELTRETAVLSPLEVVGHLPAHELDEAGAQAVSHGRSVAVAEAEAGDAEGAAQENAVALVYEGRLVAVASARGGRLHPSVVLESAG